MIAMFGDAMDGKPGLTVFLPCGGEAGCGADDMPSGPQPRSHLVDVQ